MRRESEKVPFSPLPSWVLFPGVICTQSTEWPPAAPRGCRGILGCSGVPGARGAPAHLRAGGGAAPPAPPPAAPSGGSEDALIIFPADVVLAFKGLNPNFQAHSWVMLYPINSQQGGILERLVRIFILKCVLKRYVLGGGGTGLGVSSFVSTPKRRSSSCEQMVSRE